MIKVLFVQRFMLHYRVNLISRIANIPDINLLLIHGRGIKNSKFVNYEGKVDFKHKLLSTLILTKGGKQIVLFPFLLYHLIKHTPDVIVTEGESNMLNNIIIYFYSLFSKAKLVWWGLGLIPGHKESLYQRFYKPIMIRFLRKATFLIGYSNYSKEYYLNFVNEDKILVAYNCLDNDKIDREISECRDSVRYLKAKFNLTDKFVIIYVGGFQLSKRVDKLVRAFAVIKERYPETALLLVGWSKQKPAIVDIVNKLNVKDIHFAGKQIKEISKYFLSADLFVLPGLGGLSVYHAMVHSLPVISAKADGTEKDLIRNDFNGYLLETDNIDELINRIELFLVNKELSNKMGLNSRKIVDNEININKMVGVFNHAIENSIN
jgi:glycosyltransferase involved in cell wall biosynthesis